MHNLRVLTPIAITYPNGFDKFFNIDYINQRIYAIDGSQEEIFNEKLKDFVFRSLQSQPIDIPELDVVDKMVGDVQQIRKDYQGYNQPDSEEETNE
jgi:hypothetical protein